MAQDTERRRNALTNSLGSESRLEYSHSTQTESICATSLLIKAEEITLHINVSFCLFFPPFAPFLLLCFENYTSLGIPLPKSCVSFLCYTSRGSEMTTGATLMVLLEQCSALCA